MTKAPFLLLFLFLISGCTGDKKPTAQEDTPSAKDTLVQNNCFHEIISFPGTDVRCKDIIPANDGGYIITGSIKDYRNNNHTSPRTKVLIMRIGADGKRDWIKQYGGNSFNSGVSIISFDDNYLVVGYTTITEKYSSADQNALYLLKINKKGDTLLTRKIKTGPRREPVKMMLAADKSVIICGTGNNNHFVLALDDKLNIKWNKDFVGKKYCMVTDMTIDAEGNIYLTGGTSNTGNHLPDEKYWTSLFLQVFNKNGQEKFFKTWSEYQFNEGKCITITPNGNIILGYDASGYSIADPKGVDDEYTDVALMCLSSDATTVKWKTKTGGVRWDRIEDCITTPGGNLIYTGFSSTADEGFQAKMVMIDTTGKTIWNHSYPFTEFAYSIKSDESGLIITGTTDNPEDNNNAGFVLRTYASGLPCK